MAWQRFKFYDPNTGENITLPMNPEEGGQESLDKNVGYSSTVAPDGDTIIYEGEQKPGEVSYKGKFLTVEHRNLIRYWAGKHTQIRITDDLGEQQWVYIDKLTITRMKVRSRPFKASFELHAFVLDIPA